MNPVGWKRTFRSKMHFLRYYAGEFIVIVESFWSRLFIKILICHCVMSCWTHRVSPIISGNFPEFSRKFPRVFSENFQKFPRNFHTPPGYPHHIPIYPSPPSLPPILPALIPGLKGHSAHDGPRSIPSRQVHKANHFHFDPATGNIVSEFCTGKCLGTKGALTDCQSGHTSTWTMLNWIRLWSSTWVFRYRFIRQ